MRDTPLFQAKFNFDLPKLKLLPLREQPSYRVAQNADACNLANLLAAIVSGQNQIEIAEDLLKRFGCQFSPYSFSQAFNNPPLDWSPVRHEYSKAIRHEHLFVIQTTGQFPRRSPGHHRPTRHAGR